MGLSLLKQLYSRRVTNPAQVLALVTFRPLSASFKLYSGELEELPEVGLPDGGSELNALSQLFVQHLSRYLGGLGHPNHPTYHALVSPEKRDEVMQDKGFRARQFLYQMTGTAFLQPSSSSSNLEVSILFVIGSFTN